MLIYDLEILKAIPPDDAKNKHGAVKYCSGWRDFERMGISVIGAYDYKESRYRVFCLDNFGEFQRLVNIRNTLIGFNNIEFDNNLLRANGIEIDDNKCIDLLQIVWNAVGLKPPYNKDTHAGYGLNAICAANFGKEKSGRGDVAPVAWQMGNYGEVIDYCLNDIRLTKILYNHLDYYRSLKNPKTGTKIYIEKYKLKK
jgi:hypothetical protein